MVLGYTEMASVAFAAGADASWEDYDIFTNLSVPKGSVAEILIGNKLDTDEREAGVREDGSALNRFIDLLEAEDGGLTWYSMLVQVDASTGLIEIYAEVDADIEFRCVGYYTGCTFTEAFSSWQTPNDANWDDKDLFTDYGTPKSRVAQIVVGSFRTSGPNWLGVRINGSAIDRRILFNEAEEGGYQPGSFIVKTDTDGVIEVYATDKDLARFYYLGYFDSNVDFTEALTSYAPAGDAAWENEDISGDAVAPPANGIVYFVLTHDDGAAETECGIRSVGSGLDRKYDVREAEGVPEGQVGFGITVNVDASKILRVYCEDASEANFYYLGYFTGLAPAGWTGKISGVTNPAEIAGVPVANIATVKDVA